MLTLFFIVFQNPGVLNKYVALYAAHLIKNNKIIEALQQFARHGAPAVPQVRNDSFLCNLFKKSFLSRLNHQNSKPDLHVVPNNLQDFPEILKHLLEKF